METRRRGTLNDERWEQILNTAGEVFFEKGYQGATMQEIAARLGLLKGSLYYYIKTKEDLLYELAVRVHLESLEVLNEDPEVATADAPTRLSALIERWMRRISEAQPWGAYAAVEREFRSLGADRLREIYEYRSQLRSFVHGILEQGLAEGSFDPAVDPSVVINNMRNLLWTTPGWYQDSGRLSLDEVTYWYKTLFLRGLAANGAEVPEVKHDALSRVATH